MVRYTFYVTFAAAIWLVTPRAFVDGQDKVPDPQNQDQEKIDFGRARQLLQKSRRGEKLRAEEQAYLDRAREIRRSRKRRGQSDRPRSIDGKASIDIVPLTDLGPDEYKGQDGGLYSDGRNEPPAEHLKAALDQADQIQPLDSTGKPDSDGKIVLISSGMSNVTQEFQQFVRLANSDPDKAGNVVIVDGAQGGQEASDWAYPEKRFRQERPNPWDVLDRRIKAAGVTPEQVQVLWLKQARRNPASLGEFPKHAEEMKQDLVVVLQEMKRRFPNLRIAYLSSRIYAGYASSPLNPEPYSYETAFTMRWLIQDQINGEKSLNCDLKQGEIKAPLLLWGPYLWANGVKGRKIDDLVWIEEDFARDGTHPNDSGRRKVAEQLLKFMKTDPTAKTWFVRAKDRNSD